MSAARAAQTKTIRPQARKQELMTSFVDALFSETKVALTELIHHKWPYNRVGQFTLPGSSASPNTTYWADPADPHNGVPIVLLLQGERDRETGVLHPERLPGRKTAVQLLNDRLNAIDAPVGAQLLFEKSTKELHLYIIDLDHMDKWEEFIVKSTVPKQERPEQEQEQEPEPKYPVEDEDGFRLVRRK
jgi:hypothetical protein